MPSAVRIAVTGTSADAQEAIRNADKAAKEAATDGLEKLKGALVSLAPAAIPIVAAAAPLAAHLGAGAVAAAAFGAALAPQVKLISAASTTMGTYNQAVKQFGPDSQQAREAGADLAKQMSAMSPEAQKSAAALTILKNTYKVWSDSLAKATVPVFTKSLAVANDLLPKTSGLVKGASTQFDRLITLVGGEISSPGFDAMNDKFTAFANKSLKSAIDGVVHLDTALHNGDAKGPLKEFLAYAEKEGPQVRDTLENLGKAALHIGEAAANAGPGMLTIVNAIAKLAASLPPDVITKMLQVYTAAKLIGTTSAGVRALGLAMDATAARAVVMSGAFTTAGGGAAGLRAALAGLSTAAKTTIVVAGLAAIAYGVKKLHDSTNAAGVSSTELGREIEDIANNGASAAPILATLGKASKGMAGEAGGGASAYKQLGKAIGELANTKGPDAASAALKKLAADGIHIPTKYLKDYNNAVADAANESKLAAQSMGLFGKQAIDTQKMLDKQKQAAQGLQQAIFDLNDAFRAGLDAQSDFEGAIDDLTAAFKGHGNALKFTNGELDLSTQKARDAYAPMSKLAGSAEAAADAAIKQGKGQDYANRILERAHDQLVRAGLAMGLSTKDANKLADSLDNIKDPKISVTAKADAARKTISNFQSQLTKLSKMKPSPKVNASIAQLKNAIAEARHRLDALNGKTVTTYIQTTHVSGGGTVAHEGGGYATGGPVGLGRRAGHAAVGGPRSNLTWVGEYGAELVNLAPGSSVRPHANSMIDARGTGDDGSLHDARGTGSKGKGGLHDGRGTGTGGSGLHDARGTGGGGGTGGGSGGFHDASGTGGGGGSTGGGGSDGVRIYLMVPDGRVMAEWLLEPMRDLVVRKGRGSVQQTWGKRVG